MMLWVVLLALVAAGAFRAGELRMKRKAVDYLENFAEWCVRDGPTGEADSDADREWKSQLAAQMATAAAMILREVL